MPASSAKKDDEKKLEFYHLSLNLNSEESARYVAGHLKDMQYHNVTVHHVIANENGDILEREEINVLEEKTKA